MGEVNLFCTVGAIPGTVNVIGCSAVIHRNPGAFVKEANFALFPERQGIGSVTSKAARLCLPKTNKSIILFFIANGWGSLSSMSQRCWAPTIPRCFQNLSRDTDCRALILR